MRNCPSTQDRQAVCSTDYFSFFDPALREEWDGFAEAVDAPIFMSFDWARLWWQFYGAGRELRIFIVRAEGGLVGIVPFYLSSLGVPPFRARVARLVGANIPPKIFNPPVLPEFSAQVWKTVLSRLFTTDRCDIVSVGPVSEVYSGLEGLKAAALDGPVRWSPASITERDVHTDYYLPGSVEEFFASLNGKERKIRRKKLRELEAQGPVRTDVVEAPGLVANEFESFSAQHTAQWLAEGRPGHFHAWPQALDYNRELVKAQGALGRVRFVRLLLGEQLIANQYTFAFGRHLFAELPSRADGPEWERLSLGCTSQIKLLDYAISAGFNTMKSGLGHYDYKVLLGGKEHRALMVRLESNNGASRLCNRIIAGARDFVNLTCNKLWYARLSAHLPKRLRSGKPKFALRFDF